MKVFFFFSLTVFPLSVFCLSPTPMKEYISFLKHKEKQEQFQEIQKKILKTHLKKLEKKRKKKKADQEREKRLSLKHEQKKNGLRGRENNFFPNIKNNMSNTKKEKK